MSDMYRNAEEVAHSVINAFDDSSTFNYNICINKDDALMLAVGYLEQSEKVNRVQSFIDYLKKRSSQVHEVRTIFGRKKKYQDTAWANADRIQCELDGVEYRKENYHE